MQQEVFSFHNIEQMDWSHFIEGEENHDALLQLTIWPNWNNNGLIIYGDSGVGKTHLSNLWAQTANAVFVIKESLNNDPRMLFDAECNFIIDDFDDFLGMQSYNNSWMFHFFNIAKEKKRYFLLISRLHPSLWKIQLTDLRSRLLTLPTVEMGNPSDELLLSIARKLSNDLNILISDDTLQYILEIIDRRVKSISNVLKILNKISLQKQKKITILFVKNHLEKANA